MQIYILIKSLLKYGLKNELISEYDYDYVLNDLLFHLGLDEYIEPDLNTPLIESLDSILEGILNYAINEKIIENSIVEKDLYDTKIMGCLTPLPSQIISKFEEIML